MAKMSHPQRFLRSQALSQIADVSTKKVLLLATEDFSMGPFKGDDVIPDSSKLLITLGPGPSDHGIDSIIVPSLNLMPKLQPSNWNGCVPIEARESFLVFNQGFRDWCPDRQIIADQLDAYNGTKTIMRATPSMMALSNAIFTVCAAGDLPYQKRFFDALLQCSIPVVIKRDLDDNKTTYWRTNGAFDPNGDIGRSATVENSYPHLDFSYSDIVIEVDAAVMESGSFMSFLEGIASEEIEQKINKIKEVRNRFVYDINGTSSDAFSVMLQQLAKKVNTGGDRL